MKGHRDGLVKAKRREKLWEMLHKRREQHQSMMAEEQKQQFKKYYGEINEENFSQYRQKLADLVIQRDYTYQMVIFGGIVYQYLMQNPFDQPSIKILKYITNYEQVEIPQTKQFVLWLSSLAEQQLIDSLIITANLIQHRRYHGPLRNRLLDSGFIKNIHHRCTDQQTGILLGQIICSLLSSLPRLDYTKIDQLCSMLCSLLPISEVCWQLNYCWTQIRARFAPDHSLAQIFITHFLKHLQSTNSLDISGPLDLVFFCLLSGLYDQSFIHIIQLGLSLQIPKHSQITSLRCLDQCISQSFQIELESNVLIKIWQILQGSQQKQVIVQILNLLNILPLGYFRQLVDNIGEKQFLQILLKYVTQDIHTFESLKLILTIIELYEPTVETYEALSMRQILEGLNEKNEQATQIVQMILNLL